MSSSRKTLSTSWKPSLPSTANWYGLAPNEETITLVKRDEPVSFPAKIETGAGPVTVFDPMFPLHWDVS